MGWAGCLIILRETAWRVCALARCSDMSKHQKSAMADGAPRVLPISHGCALEGPTALASQPTCIPAQERVRGHTMHDDRCGHRPKRQRDDGVHELKFKPMAQDKQQVVDRADAPYAKPSGHCHLR